MMTEGQISCRRPGARIQRILHEEPMNRFARTILVAAVVLSAPAPLAAQSSAAPTLDDLAFMAGCWRGEFANGAALEEVYTAPSANMILGLSRFLRDGRAVQYEFSRITADSTGIELLPDGSLTARIDGETDEARAQEWRMRPVSCRPSAAQTPAREPSSAAVEQGNRLHFTRVEKLREYVVS